MRLRSCYMWAQLINELAGVVLLCFFLVLEKSRLGSSADRVNLLSGWFGRGAILAPLPRYGLRSPALGTF